MQFKNPEILYLLFLLIIPIIVHLFQLQKFQKITFTNVKLLKEIEQQTRKSSKLKKILILCSRLLLFASLIFTFSQPYFGKKNNTTRLNTFIYLDNSYSMQAKGENGELLQKAKNELIENIQNKNTLTTLLTNNKIIRNLNYTNLKNEIIKVNFHPIKKDLKTVLLQIKNLKINKRKTFGKIILISDFQKDTKLINKLNLDSLSHYTFIQTLPVNYKNVSIDSVWISGKNVENTQILASIKSSSLDLTNLSISLFIDNNLYGKATLNIASNTSKKIEFNIPNKNNTQGYLTLSDPFLTFDNTLFFSIADKEKVNVLAIEKHNDFLSKIYTKSEFNFTSTNIQNLDYNFILKQRTILLNELDFIPNSLLQILQNFTKNKGTLVIIPSKNSDILSYNNLLKTLNSGKIKNKINTVKKITTINYDHPFFKDVFQQKIHNFQYPSIPYFYETTFTHATALLQLENADTFLSEVKTKNRTFYWFSSPISKSNSNFTSSPLVVPIFYNFTLLNTSQEKLFYTIGNKNEITVKTNPDNPTKEVAHLMKDKINFIPLQSKSSNFLKIKTSKNPPTNGIYQLKIGENILKKIAYNYNRNETNFTYLKEIDLTQNKQNTSYFTSVSKAIENENNLNKNKNLWQLFIIFALLFLGIEIFLQKFLKN